MKVFISLFVFLLFVGNTYAGKPDVFFRIASHSFRIIFRIFSKNPELRDMVKEGRWGDLLTAFVSWLTSPVGIIFLACVLLSIGYGIWTWNKERQNQQNSVEKADPPKDAE